MARLVGARVAQVAGLAEAVVEGAPGRAVGGGASRAAETASGGRGAVHPLRAG